MLPSVDLGTTGLTVTRMGLGMAALGRPGYINLGHADDLAGDYAVEEMVARAEQVLDAAWGGGVRYFDAARSYGRGEEFLAGWLHARAIPSGVCTVGSKWGYTYTANWQVVAEHHEIKDHSLATFQRQIDESIGLLGAYLDLYMVHSATLDSGLLERADLLDALAEARNEGRVRAIGLSLSGPSAAETLRRARKVQRGKRPLFQVVQATWNALEPSLGPLLAECHSDGMGVLVKEALANGRLTSRNHEPSFAAAREALERQAMRLGCSMDQLALAHALEQPWADCVLSGAATVEHIQSNLAAFEIIIDEEARAILDMLAESLEDYYQMRSSLAWN